MDVVESLVEYDNPEDVFRDVSGHGWLDINRISGKGQNKHRRYANIGARRSITAPAKLFAELTHAAC